jgi:hypothetical protein
MSVSNDSLREFLLYIGARDYGIHLDVSWYLTVQPSGFKRAFSPPYTCFLLNGDMELNRNR